MVLIKILFFVCVGFLPQSGQSVLKQPWMYRVEDLVDREESINSEFYLLREPQNGEVLYVPEWRFRDNWPFIKLAREVGVCATCADDGTLVSGLYVEIMAMVVTMYPPTLDALQVYVADPATSCKRWSSAPTTSPSEFPSLAPTTKEPSPMPTRTPTLNPTNFPTVKVSSVLLLWPTMLKWATFLCFETIHVLTMCFLFLLFGTITTTTAHRFSYCHADSQAHQTPKDRITHHGSTHGCSQYFTDVWSHARSWTCQLLGISRKV